MINNKKVVVVLPAYNAVKTLEITYNVMNAKLSEYHTGYRAFSRKVLERVNVTAI